MFLVVIPAYNPGEELIEIVNQLFNNGINNVIVVNDGSDNNKIFKKLDNRCIILNHKNNLGKGAAIKTSLKYYKNKLMDKYDGLVYMDCDNQHKIKDVINTGKYMISSNLFTLGSRVFNKFTPLRNKFGNRLSSFMFKIMFGKYLKDTQTGLRAIPNRLVDELINISGSRFEYEIRQLIYIIRNEKRIGEVDIEAVYLSDSNKKSNYLVFKDSYKIYREMIRCKFTK